MKTNMPNLEGNGKIIRMSNQMLYGFYKYEKDDDEPNRPFRTCVCPNCQHVNIYDSSDDYSDGDQEHGIMCAQCFSYLDVNDKENIIKQ